MGFVLYRGNSVCKGTMWLWYYRDYCNDHHHDQPTPDPGQPGTTYSMNWP